jgi:hypothetical protein
MTDNRDKILKFLSENHNRQFDQGELQKKVLTDLHKDQVKDLLYQIIDYKSNLIRVFNESNIGILPVQYSSLIDDFLSKGGFTKIESDLNQKNIKSLERESKKDEILDLDLELKRFESKIGKKIVIAGIIIAFFSFLITILTLNFWNQDENQKQQSTQVKRTEFKNGRWISISDSLSGIEIKNGKWIMFYKGMESDSTDIYNFKVDNQSLNTLGTEQKAFEYLRITNKTDTLDYTILEYSDELLSLSYIPRGNTLNYIPEK